MPIADFIRFSFSSLVTISILLLPYSHVSSTLIDHPLPEDESRRTAAMYIYIVFSNLGTLFLLFIQIMGLYIRLGWHVDGDDIRAAVADWYGRRPSGAVVIVMGLTNSSMLLSGHGLLVDTMFWCHFFMTCYLWAWEYAPKDLLFDLAAPMGMFWSAVSASILWNEPYGGLTMYLRSGLYLLLAIVAFLCSVVPRVPARVPAAAAVVDLLEIQIDAKND